MKLTDREIKLLYDGLEFMLESVTNDFQWEEMVELYKEDRELLDKMYEFKYIRRTTKTMENIKGREVILEGEPTKWLVLEDNGDRIKVVALDTGLSIPPTEICSKKHVTYMYK
tara:strand:+ start:57 stop:395 length:339 start_codon:yes stop_codon:yes gene_type:complete